MVRRKSSDLIDGLDDLNAFAEELKLTPQEQSFMAELDRPSEVQLYEEGKSYLEDRLGIVIMPDATSPSTCYLSFLMRAQPEELPGIFWPEDFCYGEPLSPANYNLLLKQWREILKDMPTINHMMFWYPALALTKTNGERPIEKYVTTLLKLQSRYDQQFDGLNGYEQGISISPDLLGERVPRAFIPELNWFADPLPSLQIGDIITLMPSAELELFSLFLGRTVCGRSSSRPVERDTLLSHKFRKLAILFGQDPRTGKSTTAEMLIGAFKRLGYSVANFRGLGNRFNMGSIYASDFAFKDDATQQSAERMLSEESTKMLVSGAAMRVEDKGRDAFNVTPNCAVMFITNSFDQNALFGKDAGIVDRTMILYTYSHNELNQLRVEVDGEVSANPRPYEHINWLANRYNTIPHVLMMLVLRKSADYFMQLLQQNQLEQRITELTDRLRFPIAHQVLPNIILAMHLSYLLRHDCDRLMPLSNKNTFAYVANAYAYVIGSLDAHLVRCLIKDDWLEKGRPSSHPWHGIRLISKVSCMAMMGIIQSVKNNTAIGFDDMLKQSFSKLQTTQGIGVGSGKYYIKRAWSDCVATSQSAMLMDMAISLLQKHNAMPNTEQLADLLRGDKAPDMAYVEEIGYDPVLVSSQLQNLYETADKPLVLTKAYMDDIARS